MSVPVVTGDSSLEVQTRGLQICMFLPAAEAIKQTDVFENRDGCVDVIQSSATVFFPRLLFEFGTSCQLTTDVTR